VSAAVKGAVRIENKKKKFSFHRIGDPETLNREERTIVDQILPMGSTSFELKSATYKKYERAKSAFNSSLKQSLNIRDYYRHNIKQAALGSVLLALVAALALGIGMYPLVSNRVVAI